MWKSSISLNLLQFSCSFYTIFLIILNRDGRQQSTNTLLLYLSRSVLYWSVYFSDNFWFFLPTFEHKYSNFLIVTFSKQACYLSLNAFIFLAVLRTLYQPKMSQHSENETQQSAHFLVRLGTARTNPTDPPLQLTNSSSDSCYFQVAVDNFCKLLASKLVGKQICCVVC